MDYLYEQLNTEKNAIKKYAPEVVAIPKYILDNLRYEFFFVQFVHFLGQK